MTDDRKSAPQEKPPTEEDTDERRESEKLEDLDIRVEDSKDVTGGNTRVTHG
jgi:hypothetical protein